MELVVGVCTNVDGRDCLRESGTANAVGICHCGLLLF